jgi:hypothetical protein
MAIKVSLKGSYSKMIELSVEFKLHLTGTT